MKINIKRIFAKFNGNPKTVNSLEELRKEYQTYKSLISLSLKIETQDQTIELSLLSACNFIITGEVQENILKNNKKKDGN